MFNKRVVCSGFVGLLLLFGCGADEVLIPGEEVVVNEWVDPVDIGKEYGIGDVEVGDTVTLSTGELHTIRKHDLFIEKSPDGVAATLHVFISKPIPYGSGGSLIEWNQITIVPDGPPIIFIGTDYERPLAVERVTKSDNIQDRVGLHFAIEVDRILDYNLPVYLEYQAQMRKEFGGEVRRVRFLTVIQKGESFALRVFTEDDPYLSVGDPEKHERACISILPYTEMEKIALPASLDISPHLPYYDMPPEDRIIPAGHTFRPYRIASSSFLMGVNSVERSW